MPLAQPDSEKPFAHTTADDELGALAKSTASWLRWEMERGATGFAHVARPAAPASRASEPPAQRAAQRAPREQAQNAAPPAQRLADPVSALAAVAAELGECTRCGLHSGRTRLVFGEGDVGARLAFVGEGPGKDEDRSGRPFVGAAGQLLDRIIAAMGLERSQVYIGNVVKCRPPDNRTPLPEECAACGPFVLRQLAIVQPEVVVALGATAARFLLGKETTLGELRGKFHAAHGFDLIATYHPAYLLRNPEQKRAVWQDMQLVMARLGLAVAAAKRES